MSDHSTEPLVEFPGKPPKRIRKLTDPEVAAQLAAHRQAVAAAEALDGREVARLRQGEALISGMRRSVEVISSLTAEQQRRADSEATRKEDARIKSRSFWDSLRGTGSSRERAEAWETAQEEQATAKAAQRADLERRRAEEARARHADQVAAGYAYAPIGGWDFDGSDAIAAVLSSPLIWGWLDKRHPEGAALTVHDLGLLLVCLALIAENGGEEVRVRLDHFPRLPEGFSGDKAKMLKHLERNGLLAVERNGVHVTIRRGPRVEALRASFAEQWLERSRS